MVKRALRNEQIHNRERRLQNVEDCVQFFTNTMSFHVPNSYESSQGVISRFFWNVRPEHIDQSNLFACNNIPRFSKLHLIHVFFVFNPIRLAIRPLACFYASCLEKDWQHCLNNNHVLEWRLFKIYPKDNQFVWANMEEDEELGLEGP